MKKLNLYVRKLLRNYPSAAEPQRFMNRDKKGGYATFLLNNNSGNAMVELMMVTTLLLLFGFTIFTLIISGSNAQKRISDNKNAQVNARIAQSYLNVRIRQHDFDNSVRIENNPFDDGNALVLSDISKESGTAYETWIFSSDGKLFEAILFGGDELSVDTSMELVEIKHFSADFNEQNALITNTISYDYQDVEKKLIQTISLRSEV